MNNIGLAFDGAWRVLLTGLLLGAGLPAVFAIGIRALAYGAGGDAEVDHQAGHPVGRVLAILCFALVLVGIALGITFVVASGFGKALSFQHIYPTLVNK
jgi:hypothetical protein